jgi:hypothetical protein
MIKSQKKEVLLFLKQKNKNIFFSYTGWLHDPLKMKQNVLNEIWKYGFNINYINQALTFPIIEKASKNEIIKSNFKNSIILNTQTNSAILENGDKFWKLLIHHLQKKGYRIIINSNKNYIDYNGIEFIKCSLSDLYSIAMKSLAIISVRSGLLDFLISSNAAIINIMPRNNLYKKYFQLTQWKSNDNILSIDFNASYSKLVEQIDNFLNLIKQKEFYGK